MKRTKYLLIWMLCLLLTVPVPAALAAETEETIEATETTAPEETTGEATEETAEETEEETTEASEEETTEPTEETKAPEQPGATSGTCGDGLTWALEDGVLTVSGSGEMEEGCPWASHKGSIRKVVFTGGVTKVGAGAFADCDALTSVEFGAAMSQIDTRAFYDCDGLTTISLPASFRRFGQECFMDTDSLTTVYCAGGMPSFNGNCLWNGNFITIYTPVNNPWPQEHVEVLVNNFHGRLEVLSGNGESMYEYTEPTRAPETTEAATEPQTQPPTTIPETEPAAETVTEPAMETVPETTVEETTAVVTEETQMPTESTAREETIVEKAGSSGWIWVVIVAASVTCLLVLALVIRMILHKDGKYAD